MDDPAINQTQESQETTPVPPTTPVVKDPATRFRGIGTNFRAKLIGIDDVNESRGDRMCQDSILKLKAAVKASGQHKQKIIINVSLDGLKIVDLLSGEIQQEHKVNRISFIARDLTDRRAFGYIYGTNDGKHQFFGIKTSKIAEHLVLALRDLFQVVYDMKKDEIAMKTEAVEKGSDDVYAVPNNRPAVKRSDGSLVDLKQQMQNMQQMSGLDAFTPWPENTPVSPDTPGSPSTNEDLFGMASSEFNAEARNGSYGNDLAALSIDAVQPAAAPGAKKTKDQILAEFGAPGMGGPGMFQQQQMAGMYQQQQNPYMAQQQMGMHANPFPGQQQGMYGGAPVPSVPAANPFAASAYGAPAVAAPMFRGPSPAIPARPGAMRPPVSVVAPSGAPQNPFGDAIGGGSVSNGLIEPINLQGGQQNEESSEQKGKSDPFASLLPGMGGGSTNKKDMFKDFQMVKPEPPPRTSDSVSANFDNYLRNSVGGVPVKPTEMNNNAPVAAPRTSPAQAAGNEGGAPSDDPFGMFANNSSNFLSDNQQQNNMQSLFG